MTFGTVLFIIFVALVSMLTLLLWKRVKVLKKYEVKYQQNNNILLETVEADSMKSAMYNFYMEHIGVDILEIKEVIKKWVILIGKLLKNNK